MNGVAARPPAWTPQLWLQIATFVLALVAVIFGAGVQWAKTTSVEAKQAALEASVAADYVRADVYASDQRALTAAIERLTKALDALSAAPPVRRGPRLSHDGSTIQ